MIGRRTSSNRIKNIKHTEETKNKASMVTKLKQIPMKNPSEPHKISVLPQPLPWQINLSYQLIKNLPTTLKYLKNFLTNKY